MHHTCGHQQAPERPPLFSSDLVNGLVALMNSNVSSPVNLVSPSPPPTACLAVRFLLWFTCCQQA